MTVNNIETEDGVRATTQKSRCEHLPGTFPPSDCSKGISSLALAPEMLPQFCPHWEVTNRDSPRGNAEDILQGVFFLTVCSSFIGPVEFCVPFFNQSCPILLFMSTGTVQRPSILRNRKVVIKHLVHPLSILEKADAIDSCLWLMPYNQLFGIFAHALHRGQGALQRKATQRSNMEYSWGILCFPLPFDFSLSSPRSIRRPSSKKARRRSACKQGSLRGWKIRIIELLALCSTSCCNGLNFLATLRCTLLQLHRAESRLLAQSNLIAMAMRHSLTPSRWKGRYSP
mmetsp:Transcript_75504/g.166788  ORF Transcript_75504/g.166788 Transcript_75504/m.166788 type:complete len:285 (-) Transcript_75504:400-1254(-)